jgi:ribosome-associated protein
MADWIIAPGVSVPEEAVEYRAVRSGGPGGQHVNKVSSKVELRVPLAAIQGLTPGAQHRLVLLAGRRVTQEGLLVMTADESRHQFANKQEVAEKFAALVREAIVPPKPRKATRATKASKERRLTGKKIAAQKKKLRGKFRED